MGQSFAVIVAWIYFFYLSSSGVSWLSVIYILAICSLYSGKILSWNQGYIFVFRIYSFFMDICIVKYINMLSILRRCVLLWCFIHFATIIIFICAVHVIYWFFSQVFSSGIINMLKGLYLSFVVSYIVFVLASWIYSLVFCYMVLSL